jgi:hypothetical protein
MLDMATSSNWKSKPAAFSLYISLASMDLFNGGVETWNALKLQIFLTCAHSTCPLTTAQGGQR